MSDCCPNCGSRHLNFARVNSAEESLRILRGVRPMRCRDCKTRFMGRFFSLDEHYYAHCPKCFRLDLNYWRAEHWTPGWWLRLRLKLGAHRYRCEYCRINFVSHRPLKELFTFQRWQRQK